MRKRSFNSRKKAGFGSLLAALMLALFFLLAEQHGFFESPAAGEWNAAPGETAQLAGDNELRVYFLDVGQGDSELIRIPDGDSAWNALIDTGEYRYADGLTDALRGLGVEKIDALICSHPHTDHMGCMARIVQRFEIGTVYMPHLPDSQVPTTSAYEVLLDALEAKNLTAVSLSEGAEISCPAGAEFQVLAPRRKAEWDDLNNYSGVIRLTYGETSFLFTGDAESDSEKLILKDAETNGWDLKSTVLKCGHHGSKTSSSANFLKAVDPVYTVISCGKDNSYGHPHEGTLEKLSKLGSRVYRTDEDGTVLAASDGKTITFEIGLPSVETTE